MSQIRRQKREDKRVQNYLDLLLKSYIATPEEERELRFCEWQSSWAYYVTKENVKRVKKGLPLININAFKVSVDYYNNYTKQYRGSKDTDSKKDSNTDVFCSCGGKIENGYCVDCGATGYTQEELEDFFPKEE